MKTFNTAANTARLREYVTPLPAGAEFTVRQLKEWLHLEPDARWIGRVLRSRNDVGRDITWRMNEHKEKVFIVK